MTDITDAIDAVSDFVRRVTDDLVPNSLRVEEVELQGTDSEPQWMITMSYLHEPSSAQELISDSDNRQYKTFLVNAVNNQVINMKIYAHAS